MSIDVKPWTALVTVPALVVSSGGKREVRPEGERHPVEDEQRAVQGQSARSPRLGAASTLTG